FHEAHHEGGGEDRRQIREAGKLRRKGGHQQVVVDLQRQGMADAGNDGVGHGNFLLVNLPVQCPPAWAASMARVGRGASQMASAAMAKATATANISWLVAIITLW